MFTHFEKRFHELSGKTWGIIGLGNIGRRVADIAKAFGCRVIYYSTSGKNSQQGYERVEFDALLEQSDIVSVHAPLDKKYAGTHEPGSISGNEIVCSFFESWTRTDCCGTGSGGCA